MLTVEQFGYLGDGSNQDKKAFKDALEKSAQTGEPVVLAAKTYPIGFQINLPQVNGQLPKLLGTPGITRLTFNQPRKVHIGTDRNTKNKKGLVLRGLIVDGFLQHNKLYHGVQLFHCDDPVVEDLRVSQISVGHAVLFRKCLGGTVRGIEARNGNFDDDPEFDGRGHSPSRPVIHFSGCTDLRAEHLTVRNCVSDAPGRDRDAVSCVLSKGVTLSGVRGWNINTLLDIGNSSDCFFTDLAGETDMIGLYLNNGSKRCVMEGARLSVTRWGILIRGASKHNHIRDVTVFTPTLKKPGVHLQHDSVKNRVEGVRIREEQKGMSLVVDETTGPNKLQVTRLVEGPRGGII